MGRHGSFFFFTSDELFITSFPRCYIRENGHVSSQRLNYKILVQSDLHWQLYISQNKYKRLHCVALRQLLISIPGTLLLSFITHCILVLMKLILVSIATYIIFEEAAVRL